MEQYKPLAFAQLTFLSVALFVVDWGTLFCHAIIFFLHRKYFWVACNVQDFVTQTFFPPKILVFTFKILKQKLC